uniref:Uncharacterized protein n=1 Tax=Ligilactobacillus acidipiscis TaxID=89059 RepID=A0A285PNQ9_9LACO|nr:hypothetical protein PLAC3_P04 [Ligilactobacillus acidipiscis]SPM00127.1 hypothetical protein PLAC03_P04 [Ligilactobacillus acidipiscis]
MHKNSPFYPPQKTLAFRHKNELKPSLFCAKNVTEKSKKE